MAVTLILFSLAALIFSIVEYAARPERDIWSSH